ncbi:MAG: dipeptide epimerase [Micavibrio sp.]|nr:dipeptide epimerase [Micavibrio sp.]
MNKIDVRPEMFHLHTVFNIARGTPDYDKEVVLVTITDENGLIGRGEAIPCKRFGETVDFITNQVNSVRTQLEKGVSRKQLMDILAPGTARCAIDGALWDLEAKQTGKPAWEIAGHSSAWKPVDTVQTLSLDTVDNMVKEAKKHPDSKILKIKLGGGADDMKRLEEIHKVRPDASLVIDANEGWSLDELKEFVSKAKNFGVTMIEQPLPKDRDHELIGFDNKGILICGDESIHVLDDIKTRADRYDMMNIKLDKAGGLTHAFEMMAEAKRLNKKVMVGCMLASSLSIAPALLLAQDCDLADLDGSWWLSDDRPGGITFSGGQAHPGTLWGQP